MLLGREWTVGGTRDAHARPYLPVDLIYGRRGRRATGAET